MSKGHRWFATSLDNFKRVGIFDHSHLGARGQDLLFQSALGRVAETDVYVSALTVGHLVFPKILPLPEEKCGGSDFA